MFARAFLLIILIAPLAEIAMFVLVGQWLGLLPTLLGVVLSALVGGLVLRWQGLAALGRLQATMQRGELPARQMSDAMLIGLGGFLLLVPGYLSDIAGILLLLPFTREAIYRLLARRFKVVEVRANAAKPAEPGLIDLDDGDWRSR